MSRIMQRMWNFLGFEDEDARGGLPRDAAAPRAPVFSLHTQRTMEIVVLEPGAYDEAQTAADYLKTNRPIVINLRAADRDLGKRVVDFLSGVTYALDGHMQRVGDEIFLFTPRQVFITAEQAREEAVSGSLFPID
ncbi:MAG TPA: cell division protein SepF [bacterium]|nr:cell division protein SepF [bacterium]